MVLYDPGAAEEAQMIPRADVPAERPPWWKDLLGLKRREIRRLEESVERRRRYDVELATLDELMRAADQIMNPNHRHEIQKILIRDFSHRTSW